MTIRWTSWIDRENHDSSDSGYYHSSMLSESREYEENMNMRAIRRTPSSSPCYAIGLPTPTAVRMSKKRLFVCIDADTNEADVLRVFRRRRNEMLQEESV